MWKSFMKAKVLSMTMVFSHLADIHMDIGVEEIQEL
jgi:hypothetical protein